MVAGVLWIILITFADLSIHYWIIDAILACLAVGLTLISQKTQEVLSSSIPAFFGRISFGLYLIHIPIICSFSCWAYLKVFNIVGHNVAAILVCFVTSLISIVAGYLFYTLVDRPSVAVSRWLSAKIMRMSNLL
jgi:peptidoglycan/LPS O-acetylase OafA/YrhL